MSVKLLAIITIFSIIALPSLATEFSLPEMIVQQGEELVIPVTIDQVKGLIAVSIEIEFDPEIISIEAVSKAQLVQNFIFAKNVPTPGKLMISMGSGRGISGEGVLINILIKVSEDADDGQVCPLEFVKVSLNGENVGTVQNGKLFVGDIISVKKFRKKASLWGRLKGQKS